MSTIPKNRIIPLKEALNRKSVLLLGPRRTGKSYCITNQIRPDLYINLLEADVFRNFSARPEALREAIQSEHKLVAIDEIQKLTILLDEVHSLIENKNIRFILTGSSARKLSRSHTSLMAGRAKKMILHPFRYPEIKEFDLDRILLSGTLPPVYLSDDPIDELRDYTGLYLREEVMAEAFVRRIENFSRFLETAALSNGQLLNFESIGRDAHVAPRTIREYYALLEDTLMGSVLYPMRSTKKRKSTSTGKFYFFDVGVMNSIIKRTSVASKTKEYGDLFEHFIYLEIKAYIDYFKPAAAIEFWRVNEECEVDFVIDENIAIEVKASELVNDRHLKGLNRFSETGPCKRKIIVSRDRLKRKIKDVEVLPYRDFLEELWAGGIF